jgi:hypothetical protein
VLGHDFPLWDSYHRIGLVCDHISYNTK